MFHDESRKPSYLGVKRSKVRVTSHKTLLEWVFALLWVLAFFYFCSVLSKTMWCLLTSTLHPQSRRKHKAFDRVNHIKLFKTLIDRGLPSCIIIMLINWYGKLFCTVRWKNSSSCLFSVRSEIRQGGILSHFFSTSIWIPLFQHFDHQILDVIYRLLCWLHCLCWWFNTIIWFTYTTSNDAWVVWKWSTEHGFNFQL